MQITLIGGIAFGFVCVVVTILLGGTTQGFIDLQSMFIVFGGVLSATIASYSLDDLKKLPKLFGIALKGDTFKVEADIDKIIELAELARKEGLLSLENAAEGLDDPFMKNGIMLMLDGSDPELVKNIMETEVAYMSDRHSFGAGMFAQMAAYAPAFGMIGTLIGLIQMLLNLSDMASLGPAMAVAIVTTFYGVILANLIFTPFSKQLSAKSEREQLRKSIIIEGILSIQDGEKPRVIRDKLSAFMARNNAIVEGKENKSEGEE